MELGQSLILRATKIAVRFRENPLALLSSPRKTNARNPWVGNLGRFLDRAVKSFQIGALGTIHGSVIRRKGKAGKIPRYWVPNVLRVADDEEVTVCLEKLSQVS